ncbi:hypothetical protein HNP86_001986 [Methanococcus maripaludis]|uniref:Uncharacterized protein n=1 Tax=Methanococcus maripaludis TaxID=39152 RepID=A0A7J9NWZ5_METMI|nr:hypothetical protein [Methanococcus maripaludis]MBA2851827.1 hypothetical protein [Methanococcus maripaludis]
MLITRAEPEIVRIYMEGEELDGGVYYRTNCPGSVIRAECEKAAYDHSELLKTLRAKGYVFNHVDIEEYMCELKCD